MCLMDQPRPQQAARLNVRPARLAVSPARQGYSQITGNSAWVEGGYGELAWRTLESGGAGHRGVQGMGFWDGCFAW